MKITSEENEFEASFSGWHNNETNENSHEIKMVYKPEIIISKTKPQSITKPTYRPLKRALPSKFDSLFQ